MFRKSKQNNERFSGPVIVAECQCVNDAEVTKSILESHGIQSVILDSSVGELLRFKIFMITRKGFVKVVVRKPDYEKAKKILYET